MIVIIMIAPFSVSVLILGVTPVVSPLTLVVPPLKFSSFSPMREISANRSAKQDSQPSGLLKTTKNSYEVVLGLMKTLTRLN